MSLATDWTEDLPKDAEAKTPPARPLIDFSEIPPDSAKTLLGERFLCTEGGMLFVGPSGIGKTSAGVQQDLLWSMGLPAFGIVPARPLQILTIQAEDDDGDLSKIVSGVKAGLHLTPEQCEQSRKNCLYVIEKSRTGIEFLTKVVRPLLEKHRPDLLRINPFQAYLGGDIKDPSVTSAFLRTGLNPLLAQFQSGLIIVHHTPITHVHNCSRIAPKTAALIPLILRFPGLLAECDSRYASCGRLKALGRRSNKSVPTAFLPKTHFCTVRNFCARICHPCARCFGPSIAFS